MIKAVTDMIVITIIIEIEMHLILEVIIEVITEVIAGVIIEVITGVKIEGQLIVLLIFVVSYLVFMWDN